MSALDDPAVTAARAGTIRSKRLLREFYEDAYAFFRGAVPAGVPGPLLELGSGAGFFRETEPRALASDVMRLPGLDLVASGLDLPFRSGSLAGLCMLDVFHHLPDAGRFLREAARTLAPGGAVAMIEPARTLWARFVWRFLHHEGYDPAAGWTLPPGGPLSTANSALPWIVLVRDRARFGAEHPEFAIERIEPFGPARYLLSGGVSRGRLCPDALAPLVAAAERGLSPCARWTGLFQRIVLRRRA